jgi:hypothetical protein
VVLDVVKRYPVAAAGTTVTVNDLLASPFETVTVRTPAWVKVTAFALMLSPVPAPTSVKFASPVSSPSVLPYASVPVTSKWIVDPAVNFEGGLTTLSCARSPGVTVIVEVCGRPPTVAVTTWAPALVRTRLLWFVPMKVSVPTDEPKVADEVTSPVELRSASNPVAVKSTSVPA